MTRKARLLAWIVLAIGLSQVRDWFTYNINYQLDHLTRGTTTSFAHSKFKIVVADWGIETMLVCKWAVALLAIIFMLLITLQVAKLIFEGKLYHRSILIGYALAGTVALLLYVLSKWIPELRMAAIQLLHALQYPILLFVLILAAPLASAKPTTT